MIIPRYKKKKKLYSFPKCPPPTDSKQRLAPAEERGDIIQWKKPGGQPFTVGVRGGGGFFGSWHQTQGENIAGNGKGI